MHEVEVKVVGTELLQGVLDGKLDVLGVVVDLEELGGDEELLSGDAGGLDTLSDLTLVLVTPSTAVRSALIGVGIRLASMAVGGDGVMRNAPRLSAD